MLNIRYKIEYGIRTEFYTDIIKYTVDNTSINVDDIVYNRIIDASSVDDMKQWVVLYTFTENYK